MPRTAQIAFVTSLLCTVVFASTALLSARIYRNALNRTIRATATVASGGERVRIYREITGESARLREALDWATFGFALTATLSIMLAEVSSREKSLVFSEPMRTGLFLAAFAMLLALFNGPRTWATIRLDHQVIGTWAGAAALLFPWFTLLASRKYKSRSWRMFLVYPVVIGIVFCAGPLLYPLFRSASFTMLVPLTALAFLYSSGAIVAFRLFRSGSHTLSLFMVAFLTSALADIMHANAFHADLHGLGGWSV